MRSALVFVVVAVAGPALAQPTPPAPPTAPAPPTPPPAPDPNAVAPPPESQPTPPPPPPQLPPPPYGQPPPNGYAQPAPPPAPPSPPEATGVAARAAIGFGRYTERAGGLLFEADLQPFTFIGLEGAFRAGERGVVLVQAQAGLGIDVHMDAIQNGMLSQNNRFHQEIYEGSLRYRWPGRRSLFGELGYRYTMQRLHFTDIEDPQGVPGPIPGATEVVQVHALEGGLGWRTLYDDGSSRRLLFLFGLNQGSAENDQIDDEDFSASGLSFAARATWHWASGLLVEALFSWRQQNGTGPRDVTVMGMQTQAIWPKNTTWLLGGAVGYSF